MGKFLNLVDDIQVVNLKNAEVFKAVTGRRSHEIERKYQDRFSADITAVHCYSCNEAPILDPVVARDSGFKSRWYFIQFSHTFPVDAGWHAENFTGPHLEGFFSRMVDTAAAMLKNGGRLLLEADPDDVINRWQNSTRSPLAQFIEQHAERGESYSILKDSFCEAFWEWIEGVNESAADKQARRRRSPQTKTAMSQSLIKLGIYPDQVGGKNRSEVYKGIRLKPTSPYVSDSP
ncbi:MAG: hypothetical protein EOM90_18815 [Alphaproteobacteria bacterium]|nr:hypothetical protein [Alphaproteobacteria bacterium]